jgi:hypothetical protein
MKAESFAEFWKLQGHRVIQTSNACWYDAHTFAYLSIPYHRQIAPSHRELLAVWLTGPALIARYPAAQTIGKRIGGLFICVDRSYDLATLDKKARNQTRRGLENCAVELIGFDRLIEQGYPLIRDTLQRQQRSEDNMSFEHWERYCTAAAQIDGFEAWAALVKGRLAAFMVAALVEDCFSILYQSSFTTELHQYPNNALVFSVVRQKLADAQVGYVSYGLKSVDPTDRLDHFKLQMGFKLRPFCEEVAVNPLLRPFLALGGKRYIQQMARRHPEKDLWRKAAQILDIPMEQTHA